LDRIICKNEQELGEKAAIKGAELIRHAIDTKDHATIIVATGASQFEMFAKLVSINDLDWPKVEGFHLDEYIGLPMTHKASFRRYLKERFVSKVPIQAFHYINGEGDCEKECKQLSEIISAKNIDVAFVGIGENGHLAFNDPPADFEIECPYIIVDLDEACRRQQHHEKWFDHIEEVPKKAISMSIKQIMKSDAIICSVPGLRKAEAVKNALSGSVTPMVPASILQQHEKAWIYLDEESASLLPSG